MNDGASTLAVIAILAVIFLVPGGFMFVVGVLVLYALQEKLRDFLSR